MAVFIHYTTNEKHNLSGVVEELIRSDNLLDMRNDISNNIDLIKKLSEWQDSDDSKINTKIIFPRFEDCRLTIWQLMKLFTVCSEVHIFFNKSFNNITSVKTYMNIESYSKILGFPFIYINEYVNKMNESSDIRRFNNLRAKCFDLRKFFEDNKSDILDLSYRYNKPDEFDVTFDMILSKNRYSRIVFIRQLLMYLLITSNFGCQITGSLLMRDHSYIIYGSENCENQLNIYFSKSDVQFVKELKKRLLLQLESTEIIESELIKSEIDKTNKIKRSIKHFIEKKKNNNDDININKFVNDATLI